MSDFCVIIILENLGKFLSIKNKMSQFSNILHYIHRQNRVTTNQATDRTASGTESRIEDVALSPMNRFKLILDKLVYFTGALSVVMAVPQALQIYLTQNASGVAFVTWFTFFINAIIWTAYGIIHKERPIILIYLSYFIIDFLIVVGILMYA